jgi:solute carrier family 25 aspartate/glutamate transporter 12/13
MPLGPPLVPTVHCDAPEPKGSVLSSALKTVRTAVAVPENELKRWRRTFEANAKLVNGDK